MVISFNILRAKYVSRDSLCVPKSLDPSPAAAFDQNFGPSFGPLPRLKGQTFKIVRVLFTIRLAQLLNFFFYEERESVTTQNGTICLFFP